MAISRAAFADLLDARFQQIREDFNKIAPTVAEEIYNVGSSTRQDERTSEIAAGGLLTKKTEGNPMTALSAHQGYDKTYTHDTYAGYLEITEEVFEDDLTGSLSRLPTALNATVANTVEYLAFVPLNDGFTTAGADGQYLWDDDHPKLSGGTWSNLISSAADIAPSTFRDALSKFYQMPDHFGVSRNLMPTLLLVHPDEYYYAREIVDSAKLADTANNNENMWKGAVKVVQTAHWTDSDAWALFAPKVFHDFHRFWRVQPSLKALAPEDRDWSTGNLRMKIRFRISHGYGSPVGTWASPGV